MSVNPYVPQPPVDTSFRPRVWPGVVVLLAAIGMLVVPAFVVERDMIQFVLLQLGAAAALCGGVGWWGLFSRVGVADRLAALALFLLPAVGFAAEELLDAPGQPPMGAIVYGVPFALLCWVGGLLVGLPFPGGARRAVMYLALCLGWLAFGLVRIDGTTGSLVPELNWRWTKKPEQAILDKLGGRQSVDVKADVTVASDDWAEFRGPNRDNRVAGVTLLADWTAVPNKVWEVDVGPGWGAFAVAGDRLYTMEQQGAEEAVICLDAATGKMAWKEPFKYPAFFKEKISGAGPRSTPTVKGGKVYTFGATGMLSCLDATTGEKVWQIDARSATSANPPNPFWGYASSPLVHHGLVVVCVPDKGTAAFSAKDGSLVWTAGKATHGYSSAQMVTIGGIEQLLMLSNHGLESFAPDSGKLLWEHAWPMIGGNRSLQPVVIGEGDYLVTSGVGSVMGTRRVKVSKAGDGWQVSTLWETGAKFSPYFNDGVVHGGYFYGFSGKDFICVDLANGRSTWGSDGPGTVHGNGQVLLFADAGQLLVTSEYGKMFLVKCNPREYEEVASTPTVPGKMWNHAAYSRGKLYVRSDRKAACIELPVKR